MTNSMPWFRVYSEILDDRKIKRICKHTGYPKPLIIGTWICLLALASDSPERGSLIISDGMPYTVDEIADEMGMDTETTKSLLNEFEAMGMLAMGETMEVANWNKRQFPSDSSAERTREYRKRHASATFDNTNNETSQERHSDAPDTDSYTDTDNKEDYDDAPQTTRPNIFKLYEQNIGTLTPLLVGKLELAEKEYDATWIDWAFTQAVNNNARSWAYVETCLKNRKDGKEFNKPKYSGNGRGKSKLPTGVPTAEDRERYAEWDQERIR